MSVFWLAVRRHLPLILIALGVALALAAGRAWINGIERDAFELGEAAGRAHVQAKLDKERLGWADERRLATEAYAKAISEAREQEQRRSAAIQEALDDAERQARRERADRLAADASAARLQDRIAATAAASRFAACNPGLALGGQATADPAGMLADVLGRCEKRVRFLADVADQRGRAGQLCVKSYEALTATDGNDPAPAAKAAGP